MADILTPADLAAFATIDDAKAAAMVDDAVAMAVRVAPCLADTADVQVLSAARAILRRAVLRWNEAGSGAVTQQQAGQFSYTVDSRQSNSRGLFWPSEITDLQVLCGASGEAFTIDMTGLPKQANPLYGAVVNAPVGGEPAGSWA